MDSPRLAPKSRIGERARGAFTPFGSATLAHVFALVAALPGCGGDPPLTTARFLLVGPPAAATDGTCPSAGMPGPMDLPAAEQLRLTYRRSATGELVCDVVLPLDGRERAVVLPDLDVKPGLIDLTAEVFDGTGTAATLLARGDTREVAVDAGEVAIHMTPANQFSCARSQAAVPRAFHSATALPNGEVLLAGGVTGPDGGATIDPNLGSGDFFATAEVEILDPGTGSMRRLSVPGLIPRAMHSAQLISTDPIRVALFGGLALSGDPATLAVLRPGGDSGELRLLPGGSTIPAPIEVITYDPISFTATVETSSIAGLGVLGTAAPDGTAWSGSPPILFGGYADATLAGTVDTFIPLDPLTGTPAAAGALEASRIGASATEVAGGQVLVWGGNLRLAPMVLTRSFGELLTGFGATPTSQPIVIAGGRQPIQRAFHRAVALPGGDVLIAGGYAIADADDSARAPVLDTVERLTIGAEITAVAIVGAAPVGQLDAVLLPSGDVLLSGGDPSPNATCPVEQSGLACSAAAAYRFATGAGTLTPTGELIRSRYGHRGVVLSDGRVLITGGLHAGTALQVIRDAEIYDPRLAGDDPLADLRPEVVRSPGDVARDWQTLEPISECAIIDLSAPAE